ncbi:saccharopine dehydrogenase-like oxidoreductase [Galendromus occidentalis]|uniref:Saccharopine dehydrogenase-like oxidoreductase n=1 Tax=Galendromus occidentalis TaxID=34638 RepID=A0AAJ7P8X1_9ACAR|nr:saccharopine dehydrogenase-like oxidoreductase [Galendromus occidentalis]
MSRGFDIILFGATGVTGRYTLEALYKACQQEKLSFAVAGRNEGRLNEALEEVAKWLGKDPKGFSAEVPKVIANTSDQESLRKMARQCRIVVNTVGPYRFYGEAVVSACVEEGTNHVDVSGEPAFIESMQLKYHELAKAKNVYIVSACGFDSIPCDTLISFTKENFRGRLNSIETFLTFRSPKGGATNTGTWNSLIQGVANRGELPALRKKTAEVLFPTKPEKPKFKLDSRGLVSTTAVAKGYSLPFPGSDRPVALTSERFRVQVDPNYKAVQVQTYFQMPSLLSVFLLSLGAALFLIMTQFSRGRSLLSKYPHVFSFGFFREGGATRDQLEDRTFRTYALGKGWHADDDESKPPTRKIVCAIDGPDPGYIGTGRMLVTSAVCILKESTVMPSSGGCIPPGFAFEKTTLRRRLEDVGFKFTVKSSE